MTDLELKDYIEYNKHLISLLSKSGQWDGIPEYKINAWIDNFTDLKGQYFALKILKKCIYYNENDIITLLKHGIYNQIYGNEIRKELIKNKELQVTSSVISAKIKNKRDKTLFIPLSDENKPHESGQQFIRYIINNLRINSAQSDFLKNIKLDELKKYEILIFVDDCIGSGHQILDFWNSKEVSSLREFAKENGLRCYCLVLVGYKDRLEEIKYYLKDLEIILCESLTEQHKVFSDESIFWEDYEELTNAKKYFEKLEKSRGVSVYGHDGLDFAVIIHKNIPDWTLPFFWKKIPDWNILLSRKNS